MASSSHQRERTGSDIDFLSEKVSDGQGLCQSWLLLLEESAAITVSRLTRRHEQRYRCAFHLGMCHEIRSSNRTTHFRSRAARRAIFQSKDGWQVNGYAPKSPFAL